MNVHSIETPTNPSVTLAARRRHRGRKRGASFPRSPILSPRELRRIVAEMLD